MVKMSKCKTYLVPDQLSNNSHKIHFLTLEATYEDICVKDAGYLMDFLDKIHFGCWHSQYAQVVRII